MRVRNAAKLICFLTFPPALLFSIACAHWNILILPKYKENGVTTPAELIEIKAGTNQKDRVKMLIFSHHPSNSTVKYHNWAKSRYVAAIQDDISIGDTLDIIYLPNRPNGRAVFAGDFQYENQAPLTRPVFSLVLIVTFFSSLIITKF